MLRVKNKKVINNLAQKSFRGAKGRNIVAAIAIALTTILFTSLFTVGVGVKKTIEWQNVLLSGCEAHGVVNNITEKQYEKFKEHSLVKKIGILRHVADSVDNPEFIKRPVQMNYMDDPMLSMSFREPTTGKAPEAIDEIIVDTSTLDLLGIPHRIGTAVPISYTMNEKKYQTKFILSGFWTPLATMDTGSIIVSDAFIKSTKDLNATAYTQVFMKFTNNTNLQQKLEKVIKESGFAIYNENSATATATAVQASDIKANINDAYLNSQSINAATIVAISLSLLLIIFTGYLIIYNIFQISVQHDIRFYGLLKTIGTTSRQIKAIIARHALMLSLFGIPSGLVIGFLIGKGLLPVIMSTSNYDAELSMVTLDPVIFIGSALFSLLTVFLSIRKPAKIAARVSPVEALGYNGVSACKSKLKNSRNGSKLYKMAFSNLARNKKRTIVTVLSLSLSLVLLNTVFTLSMGFDVNKFLHKFVDSDFVIGHANYFNVLNGFHSDKDAVSDSFIKAVQQQDGFLEGGKLYYAIDGASIHHNLADNEGEYGFVNRMNDGYPMLALYGLDDLPLSRIDVFEGKLDLEKIKSGGYIIEGLFTDDYGNVNPKASHYKIGDTVEISVGGKTYRYELMAKMKVNHNANSVRYMMTSFNMYLPAVEYLKVAPATAMSYVFNVKDGKEQQMEKFVKNYTHSTEKLMDYESKQTYEGDFKGLQTMTLIVGASLSLIVGLIGILNFINSILTGILTRKREFATMQSIGMTRKQLVKMLVLEGGYYATLTMLTALVLSALFSVTVVGTIISKLWFFSYKFTIIPLAIAFPILMLMAAIVPYVVYQSSDRNSIVEQMREVV